MELPIDLNEAAENDAVNVYITEQPTVGQQIGSALIAVAVPLVAGFGLMGAVAGFQWARSTVQNRRARKAAAIETIEESEETLIDE